MPKIYRLFSLLLMVVFFGAVATFSWQAEMAERRDGQPRSLLPAAVASPLEQVSSDTLKPGETLSQLFQRASLGETESQALLSALTEYQDPRRMRPGFVISLARAIDGGGLRKMQMNLDHDRTLNLIPRAGGWIGHVEEVPVYADTVVLQGEVESSLYGALLAEEDTDVPADERERIADILADRIFAWQVDFSRDLRKGDQFRILYERMVRPDGTAKSARVLSVQFSINQRDYEAYAFAAGDVDDYFDGNGESLRRAFLRAPLEYRRISSAFTTGRFHPILKVNRPHHGIDYAANSGTPVRAVGDGLVRRAGNGGGYGNLIEIRHARGYSSRYAHLRAFAEGIRSGVRVKQGDIIGYVGMTGLATGPHLHYEFHSGGRPVDPNSIRDLAGDPVPRAYREQFFAKVNEYVASLDLESGAVLAHAGRDAAATTGD